jgi:CzcA family heavy metal efflux pump
MLRALVQWCVRRHGVVATLVLLALALGVSTARRAPLDVFPEFVPSQVDIQTEAPGFSPQQVEQLITKPIEDAVNGATGLSTLRSESIPGLSVVTITFLDNVDLHIARQGISERLSELGGSLPASAGTPKLSPLVSSTMDLLKIGLTSDRLDAYALRDVADWMIKPRLLAIPGVAHVIVFGGAVRQIQIQPDPAKLNALQLTLTDVEAAARDALALHGAGIIDLPTQRVLLQSPTPAPDLTVLGHAVVAMRQGVPITLAEVADIKLAGAQRSGDALIMGQPGVLLSLASQYGANTLASTRAVEQGLSQLAPALEAQGVHVYPALHRPATFIERALRNLVQALLIAALLILLLLYVFLRQWQAALIAFIAIPLSLLAAIAVLDHWGYTLNTMTLGGFAVALGVLVDDAIIDIENILRRLRVSAGLPHPRPRLEVILDASLEVRRPVLHATAVVVAVFLPALFATTLQGHFVGPMALAFVLAVAASLLVAMTATPALCALLLRAHDVAAPPRWLGRLKGWQARSIGVARARTGWVIAVLLMLSLAALASLPFLPSAFMPDFREGHFVMQVSSATPGTSLEEMMAVGRRISADVLRLPYVQSVEQQVGRAQLGEDTWGSHQSEFHVELKADATVDQASAQAQLRALLQQYPGLNTEVVTFLGDRIGESLSGETAQVAIKLFGEDLDQLDSTADQIQTTLANVPGIVDLSFAKQSDTPILAVRLRAEALAASGLTSQQVLAAIESGYAGSTVGQTYVGTRTIDAVIKLPDDWRARPALLGQLNISGPLGPVPLSQVASLRLTQDRYRIEHEGGQRRVSVTFNVAGRSLQNVVRDAQAQIARTVRLPIAVVMAFTGAAEAEAAAQAQLLLYSALALGVIMIGLFVAFHWRANVGLVLLNLPFCLIGSVAAILLSGIGLSLGALVGLVTVFGISARNAILQLSHYEHLVEEEMQPWNMDTILRGANERLTPILMTAAMTALGLVPLALGSHRAGQEIEGPMAITVLGGLASSTLLNLLLLPALAHRWGGAPPQGSAHALNPASAS